MVADPRADEVGSVRVGVMNDAVAAQWSRELGNPTPGSAMLVAEHASGAPIGFVWMKTERDSVSDLSVGPSAAGA